MKVCKLKAKRNGNKESKRLDRQRNVDAEKILSVNLKWWDTFGVYSLRFAIVFMSDINLIHHIGITSHTTIIINTA